MADPCSPELPVQAGWIRVPAAAAGGPELRCWWARPAQGPPRAAVLVLPEVFGINGWMRSVAERLAAEGYGALAMPCFARTAPALDLGYDQAALAEGRRHRDAVTAEQFLADAAAAVAWLQAQPGLEGRPIGCVGFCFGGHLALLAATLPAVAACCDFYGARVVDFCPGGGPPTLEAVERIDAALLCLCGQDDPLIPASDIAAIGAALERANRRRGDRLPHRLMVFPGAGHGFLCGDPARGSHHPEAAAAGWRAMLDLFAAAL